MRALKVWLMALALFVAAGALFLYKWQVLGYPLMPNQATSTWTVEVMLHFDAGERPNPIKASLYVPALTPGFAIFDENFVSRGYGFTTRYVSGGRQVQWAIRRAGGPQTLYYRAVVYQDPNRVESDTTPPFPPIPDLGPARNIAMQEVVEQVRSQSVDPASFTLQLLARLNNPGADQNLRLLLGNDPAITDRARVAINLLAAAQIPARLVRGVLLVDREREASVVPWLEVHDGERWLYVNPANGDLGLPSNLLLWWRGEEPLFTIDGGSDPEVRFSVQRNEADPVMLAQQRADALNSRIHDFSMFALPIETQAVYGVLLMIPLGALVVVMLRNLVGISTFGTFMPVLVALAFRETQLLAGVILFSLVVVLGLSVRFFMENLRLLLVPRLTAVLVVVVLLMATISILSRQLGIDTGLYVGLFPMVIMTMTIERMSIVWEERGPTEAIQQGVGSLIVAAICYWVMGNDFLEHVIFVFPELLLWVLALTLLLGRYSGYRLLELLRFRSLATESGPPGQ